MKFEEQAVTYLEKLAKRKRNPVTPGTLAVYRSHLSNWILPEIGKLPLSKVDNAAMRDFVAQLSEADLSPAFISAVQGTVKEVVSSAIDKQGNELFPRTWNASWIDAPQIDRRKQKTPIISSTDLSDALKKADRRWIPFLAMLGSTGLRIGESLALQSRPAPNSSYYDPDRALVVINTAMYRGIEQAPKTEAGIREVDIYPALNNFLSSRLPTTGRAFPVSRQTAYNAADELKIPGFHSLRRFRRTHLEMQSVPDGLTRFWMGHADQTVGDRYVKIGSNIQIRKEWAEKIGVGFDYA
jgi:integrase